MELPKRKNNRLTGYDYSSCAAYFITICTYKRRHLFGEIVGDIVGAHLCVRPNEPDKMILKILFELENKYKNILVDYYVVMPDHIHFILFNIKTTGAHTGAPLHEIVKWFKTQTTNEYIKGVKNGLYLPFEKHIWQRNYYEHILRNEQDLYETRKYISENMQKRQEEESHGLRVL